MRTNSIPHDVVCEAIGQFTLEGSMENQVSLAEQLASQYYNDLETLLQTIEGCAKSLRQFRKERDQVMRSNFFKKYLSSNLNFAK